MADFELENFDELVKTPEQLKQKMEELYKSKAEEVRKKALEAYNIEENETYKEKIARLAELEEAENKRLAETNPSEAEKKAADKMKKEYEKVIAGLKSDLEKKDQSLGEFTKKEQASMLKGKFDEVFKGEKHKLKDSFYNDQYDLFQKRFKLEEDGSVVESGGKLNKSGGAYTLQDYANELNPEYFQKVTAGTGATNHNNRAPNVKGGNGEKINMIEANKILRENPELYAEMKKNGQINI